MSVIGVGFAEPLLKDASKEADEQNRRVELWIGTDRAIAWVSWIHIVVQAQKPIDAVWFPAEIQMPLRRLFRVRTVGQSAGEVTFRNGDIIYLGPSALVIIYGEETRRRQEKLATADVTVEAGSLLARLKQRTKPRAVETPEARITVASRSTRVNADPLRRQTTVSVYDGHADVAAQGKSVRVKQGFGTRVRRGDAPDAPTPLAKPPRWREKGARTAFEDEAVELDWLADTTTPTVSLEVADAADPGFLRPLSSRQLVGTATSVRLVAGRYAARLVGISAAGIAGEAGEGRALWILPRPTVRGGTLARRKVELYGRGEIALGGIAGLTTTPTVARFDTPGRHRLSLRVGDGVASASAELEVVVHPVTLSASPPTLTGTASALATAMIALSHPVPANLVASERDGREVRLVATDGGYVLEVPHVATATPSAAHVRILDEAGYAAPFDLVISLALAPPAPTSTEPSRWQPYLGLHTGAALAASDDAVPTVGLGGGVLAGWGALGLSLGGELGLRPGDRALEAVIGDAFIASAIARASFDLRVERLRFSLGAGGGARLLLGTVAADRVQPAWQAWLGASYRLDSGEAFIEGSFGPLGVGGASAATLGRPELSVGWRWWP